MTWGELLLLDEAALNAALRAHCAGAGARPTRSWARTMALSRRYGVGSAPVWRGWSRHTGDVFRGWGVQVGVPTRDADGDGVTQYVRLDVTTAAAERVARCRLALWKALQGPPDAPGETLLY
jgi:hypothetical protein